MEKKTFKTQIAIGRHFTLHKNTINQWFKRDDAPKRGPNGYDQGEVAVWIERCAATETTMSKTSPKMAAAKLSEVLERVRKLRLANDKLAGELIPVANIIAANTEVSARAKDLLYGKLVNELPADFSNDIPHNREIASKLADALCAEFQKLADCFKNVHKRQESTPDRE